MGSRLIDYCTTELKKISNHFITTTIIILSTLQHLNEETPLNKTFESIKQLRIKCISA